MAAQKGNVYKLMASMSAEQTATNHLWQTGKNILIVSGETCQQTFWFENFFFLRVKGDQHMK